MCSTEERVQTNTALFLPSKDEQSHKHCYLFIKCNSLSCFEDHIDAPLNLKMQENCMWYFLGKSVSCDAKNLVYDRSWTLDIALHYAVLPHFYYHYEIGHILFMTHLC